MLEPTPALDLDLPEEVLAPDGMSTAKRPPVSEPSLDTANAPSQVAALVLQLRSVGERRKAQVREEVQRVKASIAANGKKQQDAIRAQIAADLATIKGEIKLARSSVGAEAARQKSAVTATLETAFAEVVRQTEEKVAVINTSAETHKKQASSAVTTRQDAARKFGVDEGKRSKDAMDKQAQEAMMRGQTKAATYPADERGEVQAEAVLAVAQEVARKLAEPGPEAQSKMEGAGNDLADGLSGVEKEVVKGIDDQTPKVTDELTKQAQALQVQFDGIRRDVHAGLDGFVSETNTKLDEAEQSAQTALQTLETQTIAQIDASIMQIQGMLDQEADALTAAIDTLVEKSAGAAERADRPDVARVQSAVSTAEATINDTADMFTAGLPGVESAAGNEFSQGGNDVVQGVATIAGSVTSTLSEVTTAATKGLGMVGEKAQEGSKKIGEEWNGSLELAQETVEEKYAEAISGMEKEMDKGIETGKGQITVEVNNAIAKNKDPLNQLDQKMDAAAKEAAEKYDAPWYEKLGRWLLNALLGFLEALAYFLAIVVVAVLAIVLIIVGIVKGLVILVIIGIVLLVAVVVYVLYGIVVGIIARVKSAEKWWQYPLAVLVGVLDIVGIPNIIEGLIQHDIVNQRELTVEEAGRRFGTGLFNLLLFLIPLKVIKGAKGTKAPKVKPPEPTPVEPKPVEPTPMEPKPPVEVPEKPRVEVPEKPAEKPPELTPPLCFVAGTLVQTPDGPVPIETLMRGQLVFGRGEDQPVNAYRVLDCIQGSTHCLYHIEVAGSHTLSATRNHPLFVVGKSWTIAKNVAVGDELVGLDGTQVLVSAICCERLDEPVATFNIHVESVSTYFVGSTVAVWVHNADPKEPVFKGRLYWGFGASGPRQRVPDPQRGITGDLDGASSWGTNSPEEAGHFMGVRAAKGQKGNHGAISDAQLAEKGLVAVETPGNDPELVKAGLKHYSIRPATNPDPSVDLSEVEMKFVEAKLKEISPMAKAKPAEFGCG